MSKGQMLRELVNQRLNAAAEEIFGLFEKTIAEYEEEHERQKRQLEAVFQPQLRLHRTGIQQLSVSKAERTSEPLELSSSLDKENPPEPPHIKEEGMELWSSQKGEKHQELEEVQFTGVVVKEEDDEEKPQSSHFYQKQTEGSKTVSDGEDYGGPDLDQTADLSEAETENSDDNWMVASESQLGLNSTGNNEVSQSDVGCENGTTRQLCCSKCGKIFTQMSLLKVHIRTHTVEKPFSCSICGKRFTQRGSLQCHLSTHTGEKPFSCKICNKTFGRRGTLWKHTKRHTGEKPFSCPLCSKSFLWNSVLQLHMRTHTGEKHFCCSICGKMLGSKVTLQSHTRGHTGEKPFSCSYCGKQFAVKRSLQDHMRTHTGEKPFWCRICERRFPSQCKLRKHKCVGVSKTEPP